MLLRMTEEYSNNGKWAKRSFLMQLALQMLMLQHKMPQVQTFLSTLGRNLKSPEQVERLVGLLHPNLDVTSALSLP